MKLEVFNIENKKVSDFEIDDNLLKTEVKDDLIHDALLALENNSHTGSSNTLTRAEVRGGGKKPWKQKGTGRARHGSTRSPIWKGGGVTFGPRPLKVRLSVNKEGKKAAFKAVFAGKIKDNEFKVLDTLSVTEVKTKNVVGILKKLELKGKKTLVVIDKKDNMFMKASGNIANLKVATANAVNIYEMLVHQNVVATKKALEEMIRRMN
jgi:large subunit ribosomal protein L4